jgi:restriction endonuclease fold toxin 7 of polymorphic toxin system
LIVLNAKNGRTFQNAVHDYLRIAENKEVYSVALRDGRIVGTRPDLELIRGGVTDIKNVRYVSFTKQLQAQAALAEKEKTTFNLIISPNTQKISKTLRDEIWKSQGEVFVVVST